MINRTRGDDPLDPLLPFADNSNYTRPRPPRKRRPPERVRDCEPGDVIRLKDGRTFRVGWRWRDQGVSARRWADGIEQARHENLNADEPVEIVRLAP